MRTLILVGALMVATAASAVQPCATYHDTLELLGPTPLGDPAIAQYFHISAEPVNVDPRFAIAVTKARTNGGLATPCPDADHDPWYIHNTCLHYASWQDAIAIFTTEIGTDLIAKGNTNLLTMCDALGFGASVRADVGGTFHSLFGTGGQPVLYSSSCCGDCDGDLHVEIQELIFGVIEGGCSPCLSGGPQCYSCDYFGYCSQCPAISQCPFVDTDRNGTVEISDLVRLVRGAFETCPSR
jgi:hypothetical protein